MVNTNVVPFANTALPAHFNTSPEETNIIPKESAPTLSYRGKVWRLSKDGEESAIMGKNGEPAPNVPVILLDHIKPRSRVFFAGKYVAGENKSPDCASMEGLVPDANIVEPVSKSCKTCPNAVKGSKINDSGAATTLCTQTKRVAVVMASNPTSDPYLLRLAPTSIWDKNNKENEDAGWYAWDQYLAMLTAKGCTNTAQVLTRMKFDHRVEYPKVLFSAARWLTPEEWALMKDKWKDPAVKDVLFGKSTDVAAPEADAPDGADDDGIAIATPAAAPAPARAPRAPRAAPAPAPVAAPAAADDGDDDVVIAAAAPAAAAPAPAAAAVPVAPATANAGLSSLLSGWDD